MNNQEILDTYISLTGKDITVALDELTKSNWDLQTILNNSNNINENRSSIIKKTGAVETEDERGWIYGDSNNSVFHNLDQVREPDKTTNMQLIPDIDQNELILPSSYHKPDYFKEEILIKDMIKCSEKHILLVVYDDSLESIQLSNILRYEELIKDILSKEFECVQYNSVGHLGQSLINNYQINILPHLSIIDSVTGEQLYFNNKFHNTQDFISNISLFLESISMDKPDILEIIHPDTNDKKGLTICFSIVDKNIRIKKRFFKNELVDILFKYINQEYNYSDFKICSNFQRQDLNKFRHETLDNMNLNNSVVIVDSNI